MSWNTLYKYWFLLRILIIRFCQISFTFIFIDTFVLWCIFSFRPTMLIVPSKNRPRLFPLYGDYTIMWEQRRKQKNESLCSIWSEWGLGRVFKYMEYVPALGDSFKTKYLKTHSQTQTKFSFAIHRFSPHNFITLIQNVTKYYREERHKFIKSDTNKFLK